MGGLLGGFQRLVQEYQVFDIFALVEWEYNPLNLQVDSQTPKIMQKVTSD